MKYGLAELPEEKDIPELYRKMLKEGIVWGCNWINGFLESLNAERKPEDKFTVLVQNPGECEFCDFAFAVGNRICAVVFDIYSWQRHLLTYERRTRLIEASLEHRLMPIVVNVIGGWDMKLGANFSCGFEMAKRWMTDPVSGVSVFPEMGLEDDGELFYPLDEWAAELYAKRAARLALEQQGFTVVQVYPDNRFFWTKNRDGKPTWILVSFHHAAVKDPPDYSDFDKGHPNVANKDGYGVDVAIYNEEGKGDEARFKTVYRSPNIVAKVVSISKIAEGSYTSDNRDVLAASAETSDEDGTKSSMRNESPKVTDDNPFDEDGLPKKAQSELTLGIKKETCDAISTLKPPPIKKKLTDEEKKAKLAAMSPKEKVQLAIKIFKKKLAANPNDEEIKAKLDKYETMLAKL